MLSIHQLLLSANFEVSTTDEAIIYKYPFKIGNRTNYTATIIKTSDGGEMCYLYYNIDRGEYMDTHILNERGSKEMSNIIKEVFKTVLRNNTINNILQ